LRCGPVGASAKDFVTIVDNRPRRMRRQQSRVRHVKNVASSSDERILTVIESFYDAALDESLWPGALQSLADLMTSQAASFWVLDGSQKPRLPTFISINFDRKSIQDYLNGMARLDPTVRYLVGNPQRAIVHDGLLGTGRDEESRGYCDWHERNVETRFRLVGQARVAPGVQAGVALHRTRNAGKYEVRDVDRFSVLHRHLQRALAIGFRVGSIETMRQFGADWLDRVAEGVLLLDAGRRIVFANRSAEIMQSNCDGFSFASEEVTLGMKEENETLQGLIAQALSPISSPGIAAGGVMRASRSSGKRPYGIFVAPVSKQSLALSIFQPAVCVVITDPERQPLLQTQRLQKMFGLTRAEAKLAACLANGQELKSAAEELGITYGTARSRLAQIFQKTETRRQGELIRLLVMYLL
jgi:DNA-binding CsgD family transcriptional regulator